MLVLPSYLDSIKQNSKICLILTLTFLTSFIISGCSFIPREGPLSEEIKMQSAEEDYVVIDVTAETVQALAAFDPVGLSKRFLKSSYKAPRQLVGIGDVLAVQIYEAGEGGVFSSSEGQYANFPSIVVDRTGTITLPYAGPIAVKNKTPRQIQQLIVTQLQGHAIQPQAVVNIAKNEHNTIAVSGDINKPGLYPLSIKGRRLLDIVAEAGGTKYPARETYVTFIRGKQRGIQLLNTVIDNPKENIFVSMGDRIYLSHDPQRYTVLGAVKRPAIYKFDAPKVSVLEAVASAGGLMDERADSTGLFVFRYENPHILDRLGITYNKVIGGRVPTIYRINMQHARSYFYAQSFLMQDKDSVFVSNAKSVEISKVLRVINLATSSVGHFTGVSNRIAD